MRIMIFGRSGSGKSTFAHHLSQKLNLPLFHLDKYFYLAGWVERNYDEFLKIQQDLVDKESWMIDGNSTKSLEMRYSRADIVIYFNYSKLKCLYRIFKRLFFKDKDIDDRTPGCKEQVSFGLIRYMWTFEKRVKNKIKYLQDKYSHVKFIEVNNDLELAKLKKEIFNEKNLNRYTRNN